MHVRLRKLLMPLAAIVLIATGVAGYAEPSYLVVLDYSARAWLHTYWFVPFAGGVVMALLAAFSGRS